MMQRPVAVELNENNIVEYLRRRTDILKPAEPVQVSEVGGGDTDSEGYVNYIFRVRQSSNSYIVKQSRPYLRIGGIVDNLPPERNFMEYLSFILRAGIDKASVPKVHHVDMDNNIFVMEDLLSRDMRLMRFQLNEGKTFPKFPNQIATFMASNHFYTSELFLEKDVYRELQLQFANNSMRAIMEDVVLLLKDRQPVPNDNPIGIAGERIWDSPELRLELIKVRETLIHKGEGLIHGDLHTSNIFINQNDMRVIDMEYSFIAPFSFDLGYLLANFVSQYSAFTFDSAYPEVKRRSFCKYLLDTMRDIFTCYFECFSSYFDKSAKPFYRDTEGYLQHYLFPNIFHEAMGFMASANMNRIVNASPFPDFDAIADNTEKTLAQGLSLAIDEYLLRNRALIITPQMLIDGISKTRQRYLERR